MEINQDILEMLINLKHLNIPSQSMLPIPEAKRPEHKKGFKKKVN